MEINIEQLTKDAFNDIVKEAAKSVIAEERGYGFESEVKQALKDKAVEILKTDQELNDLLKDRLRYWISKQ